MAALAAALWLAAPAPPGAADLSRFLPLADSAPDPVVEFTTGWYLRGDVSYRTERARSVLTIPVTGDLDFDYATNVGAGMGAKWRWLRVDATFDYGAWATVTDAAGFSAYLTSITVLGNVYFDLGNWLGVTPYIGAGVGASFNRITGYANPLVVGTGGETASFAWAVMAGISYQISHNWAVDIGYRHLALGRALIEGHPPAAAPWTLSGLSADEVRIGLRFNIE